MSCTSNATNALKLLLENSKKLNLNINKQNEWGETPLHLAASAGHKNCVIILCKHDSIDTTIQNKWNRTPLDVAKDFGENDTYTTENQNFKNI